MFKKLVSYAVIFSILYPDIAFCMLESEGESGTSKIIVLPQEDKGPPNLSNVTQDDKNPTSSPIDLKPSSLQQSTLSSDCTMSENSLQDHSLSLLSNKSSPRSDKETSSQSEELSQESPSKASTHSSLSLSFDSTGSGLTQSSDEEEKNSPPVTIEISKAVPLQQNAVMAILENVPETKTVNQENILLEETKETQKPSLQTEILQIEAQSTPTEKECENIILEERGEAKKKEVVEISQPLSSPEKVELLLHPQGDNPETTPLINNSPNSQHVTEISPRNGEGSTSRRNSQDSSSDIDLNQPGETVEKLEPLEKEQKESDKVKEVTHTDAVIDEVPSEKTFEKKEENPENTLPIVPVQVQEEKVSLPLPMIPEKIEEKKEVVIQETSNPDNSALPSQKLNIFEKIQQLNQKNKTKGDAENADLLPDRHHKKKRHHSGSEGDEEHTLTGKTETDSENEDLRFNNVGGETAPLDRTKSDKFKIIGYGSGTPNPEYQKWFEKDKERREEQEKRKSLNPYEKPLDSVLNIQGSINSHPLVDRNELFSSGVAQGGNDPNPINGDGPYGDDFSPAFKAFLLHGHYLIEGKSTWRQVLIGGIGGVAIGTGVGNAMPVIFINSLYDLGPKYLDIITNNDLVARLFISHTAITLGVDSISRNIPILGEFARPSLEEFSIPKSRKMKVAHTSALVFMYTGVGMAALLPVYYLWNAEEVGIVKHPAEKTIGLTFFYSLASTLWLDSLFMISRPLKSWIDNKFNEVCIDQAYEDFKNRAIKAIRQQTLDQFQGLITIFQDMDDKEIKEAYTQVFLSGDYNEKLATEYGKMSYWQRFQQPFSTREVPALEKMSETERVLKILHQIYKNHPNQSEPEENSSSKVSTLFSWGIPLLATPPRGFILWYTMDSILGSLGMPWTNERVILSNIAGQMVGSFFQGTIEVNTVSKALSNWDETRKTLMDPDKRNKVLAQLFFPKDERKDHPCRKTCNIMGRVVQESCKLLGTTYLYAQGAWNTLPYLLVGEKATRLWPTWARFSLIPFGIADMFNNTVSFQGSYGGAYAYMKRLTYTYVLNPSTSYMRERLVALAQSFHNLYQQPLQPDVVKREATRSGKVQNPEDQDPL